MNSEGFKGTPQPNLNIKNIAYILRSRSVQQTNPLFLITVVEDKKCRWMFFPFSIYLKQQQKHPMSSSAVIGCQCVGRCLQWIYMSACVSTCFPWLSLFPPVCWANQVLNVTMFVGCLCPQVYLRARGNQAQGLTFFPPFPARLPPPTCQST